MANAQATSLPLMNANQHRSAKEAEKIRAICVHPRLVLCHLPLLPLHHF
jgi:hypothetical protein